MMLIVVRLNMSRYFTHLTCTKTDLVFLKLKCKPKILCKQAIIKC